MRYVVFVLEDVVCGCVFVDVVCVCVLYIIVMYIVVTHMSSHMMGPTPMHSYSTHILYKYTLYTTHTHTPHNTHTHSTQHTHTPPSTQQTPYPPHTHTQTLYFEQQGHPLPPKFNPADWLMDVVSLDYRSPEALEASQQRIETLIDAHAMQRGALQV